MLKIIQEEMEENRKVNWKKEILANWKQELKDNLWLVKIRQWEVDIQKIVYYTFYENDNEQVVSKGQREEE